MLHMSITWLFQTRKSEAAQENTFVFFCVFHIEHNGQKLFMSSKKSKIQLILTKMWFYLKTNL